MRHRRQTHRLGRNFSKRTALLDNLAMSLLERQAIQTTLPKAKAAQRVVERLITRGKADTLANRRLVFATLQDHELTAKLFKEIAPRFKDRKGGYTRIFRLARRKGDGADMALLELTEKEIKIKVPPKKKDKKAAESPKAKAPRAEAEKAKHEHEAKESHKETHPETKTHPEREEHPKHTDQKKGPTHQPKGGFFKNLGRFFRNKGGG